MQTGYSLTLPILLLNLVRVQGGLYLINRGFPDSRGRYGEGVCYIDIIKAVKLGPICTCQNWGNVYSVGHKLDYISH